MRVAMWLRRPNTLKFVPRPFIFSRLLRIKMYLSGISFLAPSNASTIYLLQYRAVLLPDVGIRRTQLHGTARSTTVFLR